MASFTCGSMDYRLSGDAEWEQLCKRQFLCEMQSCTLDRPLISYLLPSLSHIFLFLKTAPAQKTISSSKVDHANVIYDLASVLGNDKAIEDVVICPNLSISQKTKSGDSYCQVVWSPQHRAASTVTRVAQNGKIEWHIEWTCLDMPRWGPRTALRGEEGVAAMKTALEMAANFPLPTIVRQTDPAAVHSIRLRLLDSDWTEKPEMQNPAGVLRRLVSGEITYDPETEEGAFLLHMEQALMADFKKQERDLAISKGGRIQTHATEGGAGIVVEIFPAKDPAETEIDLEARKYGQAYAVYSKTVFPKAEAKKHRIHGFGGKPTWQVSINPDLKGYDAPVVGMIANSFSGDVDRYANKTEDGVTFSIILNAVTRDRALDAIGDFQADLNELSMKSLGFLAPQQARSVLPLRGLFLKACRFDWPNENDMPWDEIIEPAESCLQGLNDSQRQMIEISLAYRISLVWGAPGTGKSEAIIRLIDTLRSGNPNERILVCAVANVAVDQIATRAHIYFSGRSKPERMVRIYSETQIDCFYAARNQTALANPIGLQARRIDWARKNDSSDFLAGVTLLEQLGKINDKEVAKKYRKSRDHITEKVLADTFIVFTTCVGSRARALCGEDGAEGAEAWKPGSLIIDEFGNTTPPSVLIPLSAFASTLRRFVAVGEDKELGPFRDSSEAERFYPASFMRQILKKDLFPVTQLNINYRSHSRLFAAVSEVIYNGGITSAYPTEDPSPFLEYYLVRMPLKFQVEGKEYKVETYLNFIDVDGRSVTIPQGSSYNEKEVNVVNALVLRLLDSGFDGRSIIVITPYLLQRSRLRDAARQNGWSHIKRIGTVDTAQGDEAEVCVKHFEKYIYI